MTSRLRVAHLVASVALTYPDESLLSRLPALRHALTVVPGRLAEPLGRVVSYLDTTDLSTVAAHYVETFDLRRKCCLYLTYYTHGDTRRRGLALLSFRQAYQEAGMSVSDEELPDHLAVVLEFSAAGHPDAAVQLLMAHRPGLDLLWRALDAYASPFADAVLAVRASLPPPGRADDEAARRLAQLGPPVEQVGVL